jgi:hypothetical protein
LINMAFTMACLNFKKGLKMAFGLLGVKGRCIFDNVLMVNERLEWAITSQQPHTLLLLDFEKAYDIVSWRFLKDIVSMLHMGFSNHWVQLVMALYTDAYVTVILNGQTGSTFALERSVCQGCPLAPYLYLLVTDVLVRMLDDRRRGINVLGFQMERR